MTSVGEKAELRDLVAKTGEAYLDALSLRASRLKAEELFQDKELVSESIYRMERLANLRALKEKFYREYDDPVARGNNQAIWKLNEIEFERDFSGEAIARREGNRRLKLSAVKESMENIGKQPTRCCQNTAFANLTYWMKVKLRMLSLRLQKDGD